MTAGAVAEEASSRVGGSLRGRRRNSAAGFHQRASAAPWKACTSSGGGSGLGNVHAESSAATRAATVRAGQSPGISRTLGNRRPAAAAPAHRSNVCHRTPDVVPKMRSGLTSARMALGVISSPNNASAQAIADAVYKRLVSVSLGPTVVSARHAMQRYRRTSSVKISGGVRGATGPHPWRERFPWPCTTMRPPNGVLAALHTGQHAGLTAATEGIFRSQDLTAMLLRTISRVPCVSLMRNAGHDSGRVGARPGSPSLAQRVGWRRSPAPSCASQSLSLRDTQGSGCSMAPDSPATRLPGNELDRISPRIPQTTRSATVGSGIHLELELNGFPPAEGVWRAWSR